MRKWRRRRRRFRLHGRCTRRAQRSTGRLRIVSIVDISIGIDIDIDISNLIVSVVLRCHVVVVVMMVNCEIVMLLLW